MNDELLLDYLNDHLAGSVLGIETGERCRDKHADPDLAAFLDRLLGAIREDQDVLKDVIAGVGGKQSATKKAAAWLSEKGGRLKMLGSNPAAVAFSRMEELELLMLGIRGKLGLWEVLEDLARSDGRLAGIDWGRLKRRAAEQVEQVNERRVRSAREAFLTGGASG